MTERRAIEFHVEKAGHVWLVLDQTGMNHGTIGQHGSVLYRTQEEADDACSWMNEDPERFFRMKDAQRREWYAKNGLMVPE